MTEQPPTTSAAPGWYPDAQVPHQMRWWDGTAWTADTYERVEPLESLAPRPAQQAATTTTQRPARPVTEDGVALASWGRRAVARLIDIAIITPIGLALAYPWVQPLVQRLVDEAQRSSGSASTNPFAVYDAQTLRDLAVVTLISLLIGLVYEMVFLLTLAATPGKLLLRLRVRRWAAGERLTPSVVARRWVGYQGLAQVPSVGGLYSVVDVLWPLWDPRRQALHDKIAGTCVVAAPRRTR